MGRNKGDKNKKPAVKATTRERCYKCNKRRYIEKMVESGYKGYYGKKRYYCPECVPEGMPKKKK